MKTITAHIPKITVVATFRQNDGGQWFLTFGGKEEICEEADVIETCKKAINWTEIRQLHFPMQR